jgi:hypothetical protein
MFSLKRGILRGALAAAFITTIVSGMPALAGSGLTQATLGKLVDSDSVVEMLAASEDGRVPVIVEFAAPIHHSKAMLVDPQSGEPTRVRRRRDTVGTVERIAVKSDQPIPRSR